MKSDPLHGLGVDLAALDKYKPEEKEFVYVNILLYSGAWNPYTNV